MGMIFFFWKWSSAFLHIIIHILMVVVFAFRFTNSQVLVLGCFLCLSLSLLFSLVSDAFLSKTLNDRILSHEAGLIMSQKCSHVCLWYGEKCAFSCSHTKAAENYKIAVNNTEKRAKSFTWIYYHSNYV